jgi:hypothetical protein
MFHENNAGRLHDVELNELACKLDWFVKLKANILGAIDLLQRSDEDDGCRMAMGLYRADESFLPADPSDWPESNGEVKVPIRHDVYVWVPAKMASEICQGSAKRWFGKPTQLHCRYLNCYL